MRGKEMIRNCCLDLGQINYVTSFPAAVPSISLSYDQIKKKKKNLGIRRHLSLSLCGWRRPTFSTTSTPLAVSTCCRHQRITPFITSVTFTGRETRLHRKQMAILGVYSGQTAREAPNFLVSIMVLISKVNLMTADPEGTCQHNVVKKVRTGYQSARSNLLRYHFALNILIVFKVC